MPDGDAQKLYRLRATLGTENIPVFVLSGCELGALTEQTLKRAILGRPGPLRVFRKSFDMAELFEALQKYCGFERHRAHDRIRRNAAGSIKGLSNSSDAILPWARHC